MARLPADPEGFIRANTALEAPAMVPEFKLWLASEYVPIWQATEAWLEAHNVDPPYWAFCWPGGQAIAHTLNRNRFRIACRRCGRSGTGKQCQRQDQTSIFRE